MTAPTPWSLQRRVLALSLLICMVLAFFAAGATTTALANRGQVDRLLDSVGPMRVDAFALGDDLTIQETAVRAYVLTGNEDELVPYWPRIAQARNRADAIETNAAATAAVREQVATVMALALQWRTAVAEKAIAAVRQGDRDGATTLINTSGRDRFGTVQAAVNTLQATLTAMRDDVSTNIKDTSSTLVFVLMVAVILAIASGVALVIALRRSVIAPLTHLAAQVRAVSRGNFGQEIATVGPPELANLARDVDVMRRRIAADLAEVDLARRQIEEAHTALERQAAELVRSNRDLEQFAYVASHDLQEPLRKVASFCQLLQRRYQGKLDERADEYIAFAVTGAQRMQRLINDLLAFSRIGRNTSGFTEVDLARVVAEAAAHVDGGGDDDDDGSGHDSGGRPEVTWSELPVIRGEESLLTTLFINIIGNAVKFRRPGVPPAVRVSASRVGTQWEISCADNGIGIAAEHADKVFLIFQRLHPRDAYPGTGIGLAVAKKIVEYHGGSIWIDPGEVPGTTVRFTLPGTGQGVPSTKEPAAWTASATASR